MLDSVPENYSRFKSRLGRLGLILLLYLALAVIYSVVTPIGRGADEWAHYWYAQFIAGRGRLPANPVEREAAGYKSDWPPLYHLFAAGVTGWIETDGPPTFKYRQDNIRRQLVPAQGPEAILHTEDERFPWRQEILVWHLGRFLSIAFSLGALFITYLIALELFTTLPPPSSLLLTLTSVAVLAFNPRFLFTGMLFSYDSLTLLLSSLFLWLLLRIARGYYLRWGFIGLGLLAGLAVMTKYLAALLPVMIVAVAILLEAQRKEKITATKRPATVLTRQLGLRLGQAVLAFALVTTGWFGYLIINFNEIETYGPVLGTAAPLLRGDGSDRTVEEIFAFLSGGQAPAPAYIDKPDRTAWQIIAELPLTFWGNPISQPYPLTWFIVTMTSISLMAAVGLVMNWRSSTSAIPSASGLIDLPHEPLYLLVLYSLLPLPFMLIRLFGARDALEAVQGRHLLFLAGPALAILLVWGLSQFIWIASHYLSDAKKVLKQETTPYALHPTHDPKQAPILRVTCYVLLTLLLTGAIAQLLVMRQTYPPLLPVQTQLYAMSQARPPSQQIALENGAKVIDYKLSPESNDPSELALHITLIWQAGPGPAQEDYQMELALADQTGKTWANWRSYQTQARYPTRAWEARDTIRDEGWLPLVDLTAGDYVIQVRILGEAGPVMDWRKLSDYHLGQTMPRSNGSGWVLWQRGEITRQPPLLRERETAQFTLAAPTEQQHNELTGSALASTGVSPLTSTTSLQLVGPDGLARRPVSSGERWANFIIGPDWPAGDYYDEANPDAPFLRVAENRRSFQIPEIPHSLGANFEGKIRLLGYDLPSRRAEPGGGLPITLYWQGLEWLGEEFVIFNRLLDNPQDAGEQRVYGGYDRLAQENYSTLLWAPGEVVIDGFAIPIAPDTPDGVYMLNLGWYRQINGQAESLPLLNPETGQATDITAVTIGPIKVGGPPPGVRVTPITPQSRVDIVLGEQIKMLGFDLAQQRDHAGGTLSSPCPSNLSAPLSCSLELTLYWQAVAPPLIDYTVFAHVRDAAGNVVAQKDQPPLDGTYPTSLWETGEIIPDKLVIPLEQLRPGRYELVAGLYDFSTGARLAVPGSPDNSLLLQTFEVVAQ